MAAAVSLHELDEELRAAAAKVAEKRACLLRAAREDAAAFNAYVLRDEENGKAIALAEMHVEWHELIDSHDRVLIWSHVEAGKTQQISVGRTLFELGRDSSKRIVVLSKTQGQAVKVIRSVGTYIEKSDALREVFPNLWPSVPWTSTALMVQREVFSKDFSVQACGVGGVIVGARIDVLIIDDILDWKNTRTPAQRAELLRWFRSEFIGRLTANAKVIVVGNAYHPEDLLHTLAREGYTARTYPITLKDGSPRFPRKWTPRRIAAKRIELGPLEAARQLDCVARKDADVRCKEEWIRKCLARGDGVPLVRSVPDEWFTDGSRTYTGVDIGVGKKKKNAKTVVFTMLVHPNGDRRVLWVDSGRWSGLEIVQRVVDHHLRYKSIVLVEDNGAQKHLLDFAHAVQVDGKEVATAALCILPHHTGQNKTHPVIGVESIFAEFQLGRWIIPSTESESHPGRYVVASEPIGEWLSDCENYDPERHTGDHLMASWIACSGSRLGRIPEEQGAATVAGDESAAAVARARPERAADLEGWESVLRR